MGSEVVYGAVGLGALIANLYGSEQGKQLWESLRGRNAMNKSQTIALLLTERGKREWRRLQSESIPEGYVRVPILDTVRTTINTQSIATIKEALKRGLSATGRSEEDWRCVWWLHLYETANYRAMWNFNTGNRKVIPLATETSIREGFVYVRDTVANGVYGLIDRVRSFDLYLSFQNFEDGLRGERAWLERHGYHGVLRGYRQGGVEGLSQAIRAAAERGYWGNAARSEPAIRLRIANAQSWWARNTRIYGTEWSR